MVADDRLNRADQSPAKKKLAKRLDRRRQTLKGKGSLRQRRLVYVSFSVQIKGIEGTRLIQGDSIDHLSNVSFRETGHARGNEASKQR